MSRRSTTPPPMFCGYPIMLVDAPEEYQRRFEVMFESLWKATEPGVHRPCHCAECDTRRVLGERVP